MKATYKDQSAEVWEISKNNEFPDWVKEAFEKNYLVWLDDRLRILMAGLFPPMIESLQRDKASSFHAQGVQFGVVTIGYVSDYLDVTNHRVVSKQQFAKQYRIEKTGN
ncbi:hypothetical protein [Lacticaseibacillus paracasei]|uniref:hypothetical protein n=1 Tax=Lacticaseibacillus paracasei TaxID=1597 RepID=UPI0021A64C17|nr:hypothetical protein [Lacticaseibacillus paracasei]MCT4385333.1 hypothetical protein [Lacticaseibacillus paracasei]